MSLRKLINNKILHKRGMSTEKASAVALMRGGLLTPCFPLILDYEVRLKEDKFFFLQIGANDGVSRDDDLMDYVRDYGVRGIMVEPQQVIFRRLEENYSSLSSVTLVNKALHETDKKFVLYTLDVEKLDELGVPLPLWARTSGIASFSRSHLVEHVQRLGLSANEFIVEIAVPCMTLDELIKDHAVEHIDLLKVDTEGYDYNILKMLDLSRVKPKMIRFEHSHMGQDEYDEVINLLLDSGYKVLCEKSNTSAIRAD